MNKERLARGLAAAFLASDWTPREMVARGEEALDARAPWLGRLAERVRATFTAPPRDDVASLAAFLALDEGLEEVWSEHLREGERLGLRVHFVPRPEMRPDRRFPVPELATHAALATWLGVSHGDLDWFADAKGWLAREPRGPLQHYSYRWVAKTNGAPRLIEAPKEMLKGIQRRILDELLARVPPHDAAHGFRRGRSVVTFAAPHCGKELVLRMDLRDFFPSVSAARVAALFRSLGYPRAVAFTLAGLVTTRTPEAIVSEQSLDQRSEDALRRRHLPQGAPTSPAIANLCAFGLDVRLAAAAKSVSGSYTRYADDLAFSGDAPFRAQAERFRVLVCRIAAEEGFTVRWEKNRWMRPCVRQRLGGLVVNARPRPSRAEFDRLKATLTNCARRGAAHENRDRLPDFQAHLRGRVGWFEHVDPPRGARLRAIFERITW